MRTSAVALLLLLSLTGASGLAALVRTSGDEKADFAILQGLEYSHRGKPVAESLPTIFVPSDGPAAGEAFLVFEDPERNGSAVWVALDRLQADGNLFALPASALIVVKCEYLRGPDVDRWASTQVAEKLHSTCMN